MLTDVMVVSFGFAEGKNYGRYSFRDMVVGREETVALRDACAEKED